MPPAQPMHPHIPANHADAVNDVGFAWCSDHRGVISIVESPNLQLSDWEDDYVLRL